MSVAIIPARGGSKRIPNKNIRPFFGKPMIQYSIEAAQKSGLFEEIIVSTDSLDIAAVARAAGASVPMLRPAELSSDHAQTVPVILHAARKMARPGHRYGCCILATAPFLDPQQLKRGFDLLREKKAASAYAVTTFEYPIFRAFKKNEEGFLRWVWPEYRLTRSNDLPETFHDAGQFYWFDMDRFLASEVLDGEDLVPVVIPRNQVQDIDTPEDWEVAETLYRAIRLSREGGSTL
jgi:pseudaminic acid cytidylyltransferase